MRIVYHKKDICEYVGATTAKCQLSIFGRWCDMTVTAYCVGENPWDVRTVACSYGIRPLSNRDLDTAHSSALNGVQDGMLRLARGSRRGSDRQEFLQALEFPTIAGQFFDNQTLAAGGVPAARDLIRDILRGTESMIETIRQTIRCSFPPNIRDIALKQLEERYGAVTKLTLESLLGEIHWRLMLDKSGCDDQQFGCVVAMAENNPPRFYDVNFEGDSDIPLVGESPDDIVKGIKDFVRVARARRQREEAYQALLLRDEMAALANAKATSLLQSICGEKMAREFDLHGYITVEQNGYTFEIPPNAFIRCTDPAGKKADLCIHTASFQVNPIDEVIIAYLHIKHKLADYMRLAVAHGADKGFQKKIA